MDKCLNQGKNYKKQKNKSELSNILKTQEGFDNITTTNNNNNLQNLIDNLKNAEKNLENIQNNIKEKVNNYKKKVQNSYIILNTGPKQLNVKVNNLGTYILDKVKNDILRINISNSKLPQYAINNGYKCYAIGNDGTSYVSNTTFNTGHFSEVVYADSFNDIKFNTIILGYNATIYFCLYQGEHAEPNGGPSKEYYNTLEKRVELMKELLDDNNGTAVVYSVGFSDDKSEATSCTSKYLGCYADIGLAKREQGKSGRAISDFIAYNYTYESCKKKALDSNASVFGLQAGNRKDTWCLLGNSLDDAKKYGPSTNCTKDPTDGIYYGGQWTNAIYSVGSSSCTKSELRLDEDGGLRLYDLDNNQNKVIINPPGIGGGVGYSPDILPNKNGVVLSAGEFLNPGDSRFSKDGTYKLTLNNYKLTVKDDINLDAGHAKPGGWCSTNFMSKTPCCDATHYDWSGDGDTKYICPSTAPVCIGYVPGIKWGSCTKNNGVNKDVLNRINLYMQTNSTEFINKYKDLNNLKDSDIITVTSIPENTNKVNLGKMIYQDENQSYYTYPESMLKNTENDIYQKLSSFTSDEYLITEKRPMKKVDGKSYRCPSGYIKGCNYLNTGKRCCYPENPACVQGSDVYCYPNTKGPLGTKTAMIPGTNDEFLLESKNIDSPNADEQCKKLCNKNDSCEAAAISYYDKMTRCDLLNNRKEIINNSDLDSPPYNNLYIRIPTIENDDSCPSFASKYIDTNQEWGTHYGGPMTSQTKCSLGKELNPLDNDIQTAQKQITKAVNALKLKIQSLTVDQKKEFDAMGTNMKEINNLINKYTDYKNDIKDIDNMEQKAIMGGQIDDSHMKLLSNNYQYILWAIVAMIIIIGLIKITKR